MRIENSLRVQCGIPIEKCACGAEIVRVRDGKEIVIVTYGRGKTFDALHEVHNCEYSRPAEPEAGASTRAQGLTPMCRSCNAPIGWEFTQAGQRTPINRDGSPHWATCPNADEFRREKRASPRNENAEVQAAAPALWNGENNSPGEQLAARKSVGLAPLNLKEEVKKNQARLVEFGNERRVVKQETP